ITRKVNNGNESEGPTFHRRNTDAAGRDSVVFLMTGSDFALPWLLPTPEDCEHAVKKYALLLLLLLPTLLFARPEAIPQQNSLVITHVTVIDATGAAAQPDRTVLITGDRIAALGETGKVSLPPDAQQVDATGQFLIPGLWDMHAHWSDRIAP